MVYPDGGPDITLPPKLMHTHVLRPQAGTHSRSLGAQQAGMQAGRPGEWGYDYNDSRDDELRHSLRLRFKAAAGMHNSTFKFETEIKCA